MSGQNILRGSPLGERLKEEKSLAKTLELSGCEEEQQRKKRPGGKSKWYHRHAVNTEDA